MTILDENIDESQCLRLRMWRIRAKQIGVEIGKLGMKDRDEIIPLLHAMRRSTFFTRDRDFYDRRLIHRSYCLVYLDVKASETAHFVRAFLRHTKFRTQAQRLGKIARLHHSGITFWNIGASKPSKARW
jgi:hypothetical protein